MNTKSSAPLFIVGVNGSGTTMLAESIGRHPGIYIPPDESRVLPYYALKYSDECLKQASNKMELAKKLTSSRSYLKVNRYSPININWDQVPSDFSSMVGAVYERLARNIGKGPRWGDKSPMYVQHIHLLGDRFPSAQFIHIFRDGRDSAQSFHRRWRQDPRRSIYRWKNSVALGRLQGGRLGPSRYMEVCYEKLTGDPETWMGKICDFIGLQFNPVVLQSSMFWMADNSLKSTSGRIVTNNEKWRDYFSNSQIRELELIGGRLLADLGYEVSLRGDDDPRPMSLRLWKARDWLYLSVDHFRRHGFSKNRNREFIGRVVDAFRQSHSNRF